MCNVRLEQVSCGILDQVSMCVRSGESVALLGRSGAGKSTLLKVIAGLLPYQGLVCIGDCISNSLPPHRRRLGYLSQNLHLFPHLSVANNVLLAMAFGFDGEGARRERVSEALRLTHADHIANRRPDMLSGGERQRAALARCLVKRPRLLLLDEPFSSLDPETKRLLWLELDQLRRRFAITMLIVTHDPAEASALADRTIHLNQGRLLTCATETVSETQSAVGNILE